LYIADSLENDRSFDFPRSDWSSGCYGRYSDLLGRAKHDQILQKVKTFIK